MDPIMQDNAVGISNQSSMDSTACVGPAVSSERLTVQEQYPQPSAFIMPSTTAASLHPPLQQQPPPPPPPPFYSYTSPYASSPSSFQPPTYPNLSPWNPYPPPSPTLPPNPFVSPAIYPEGPRDMTYPSNSMRSLYYDQIPPESPNPIVPLSIGVAITLLGMATVRWLNGEDFILFPTIDPISTLVSSSSTTNASIILPKTLQHSYHRNHLVVPLPIRIQDEFPLNDLPSQEKNHHHSMLYNPYKN